MGAPAEHVPNRGLHIAAVARRQCRLTTDVTSNDLDDYLPKTLDLVFLNAARLMQGKRLVNLVDPARGY